MAAEDFSAKFASQFALEEAVSAYWAKNKTFQKSLEQTRDKPVFSFYDGPPFITGIPHYATLLPSIAKDVIPRYQTMKGRYVRRIWGWDTHGLPAENQVEKQLGLKTKKDIETLGVDKFIAACRAYVAETSGAWRWYIDHIGRWAELDNAYRTDDLQYMESVIWAFKQLYDKDLIYRGRRVSLYCTRCATPLSKFEVTMDEGSYRE
ncbi:MAG: class I tRNA ligase family protein, partial [Patescibacteria group bacterium]